LIPINGRSDFNSFPLGVFGEIDKQLKQFRRLHDMAAPKCPLSVAGEQRQ
jgi:hypothetical protein